MTNAQPADHPGVTITPIPVPGVTESPQLLLVVSSVSGMLTEAVAFGVLKGGIAQAIASIAGIAVPLAVLAYDAVVRLAHAHAAPVQLLPFPKAPQAPQVRGEDPAGATRIDEALKLAATPVDEDVTGKVAAWEPDDVSRALREGLGKRPSAGVLPPEKPFDQAPPAGTV